MEQEVLAQFTRGNQIIERLRKENSDERAEIEALIKKFRRFEVRYDRNTQSFQLLTRVDSRLAEMGMDSRQWRHVAEYIGRTIEHELRQFDFLKARTEAPPYSEAGLLGVGDYPGDPTKAR